jgi:hypothetical protein
LKSLIISRRISVLENEVNRGDDKSESDESREKCEKISAMSSASTRASLNEFISVESRVLANDSKEKLLEVFPSPTLGKFPPQNASATVAMH